MISTASNFRRKVRFEKTMSFIWTVILYLIPIIVLIVVGVLSLAAIANPT